MRPTRVIRFSRATRNGFRNFARDPKISDNIVNSCGILLIRASAFRERERARRRLIIAVFGRKSETVRVLRAVNARTSAR